MNDQSDVNKDDDEDGPLFSFDDSSSMPHWSEPATGEMPIIDPSDGPAAQGGSRLFPQLPDDPNLVEEERTTGVVPAVGSDSDSDFDVTLPDPPASPTGIDLGGSLAGGYDDPAPTGPMDDIFAAAVDGDADLPAPRWGAAGEEAIEGFIGSVDPEALAAADEPASALGDAMADLEGSLADLKDATASADEEATEFDGPGAEFARPGDEFAQSEINELDEQPGGATAAPFVGEGRPPAYSDPPRVSADDSGDSAPVAVGSSRDFDREDLDAWSALDDPSPVWREGAQDYEHHRPADDAAERMILHMPSEEATPGTPEPPSSGRNMPVAVGVGLTLAAIFLGLVDRGPGYAMIMIVPLLVLATSEFFVSVRKVGYRPATLLGLTAVAGLPLAAYWKGPEAIPLVLTLAMVFGLLWYLFGVELDRPTANVSVTLLGIMWVGLLGAHIPLILELPNGSGILLGAIIGTVTYDVAGLFIGRATGQSRLAPNISPNKTYEGLIGGMILAILVVTFGLGLAPGLAPWDANQVDALLLGVVIAVVAPLGDLAQSLIKRDLGIKDMGTALPGHGGVFDRFDALLLVIPAVYYLALARDLNLAV